MNTSGSERQINPEQSILLFDGVCNLCNGIVRFVLKRDPSARFLFASLQSESGRERLARFGLSGTDFDTVILIEDGNWYGKSSAALRTLRLLGWPWKALYAFMLVPRPIRDAVYDLVARNRYRVFGKRESCMLPTPELRARFLP